MKVCVGILVIALITLAALAAETRPSVGASDAVLTGKVLSVEKVRTETNGPAKYELWRAKVRVQIVLKQDVALPDTVFLYYQQDHADQAREDSFKVFPVRPRIAVGDTRQFYCRRQDLGTRGKALFIPEAGWISTHTDPLGTPPNVSSPKALLIKSSKSGNVEPHPGSKL